MLCNRHANDRRIYKRCQRTTALWHPFPIRVGRCPRRIDVFKRFPKRVSHFASYSSPVNSRASEDICLRILENRSRITDVSTSYRSRCEGVSSYALRRYCCWSSRLQQHLCANKIPSTTLCGTRLMCIRCVAIIGRHLRLRPGASEALMASTENRRYCRNDLVTRNNANLDNPPGPNKRAQNALRDKLWDRRYCGPGLVLDALPRSKLACTHPASQRQLPDLLSCTHVAAMWGGSPECRCDV